MAIILKQSTASQEVLLGPFLDDTDGKTAETGLTIANTDIKIWKAGGTTEASKNSGGATHIAAGRYYAVLDATDTDTLGSLEINVHVSGALPVRRECMVLSATDYDAIVSSTGNVTAIVNAVADLYGTRNAVEASPTPSTTGFQGSTALSSTDDFYNGCVLVFTSGALNGQCRKITDYTGSSRAFAFTAAFSTAPSGGDTFVVLGRIE